MRTFPEFAKDFTLYEVNLRQYTPSGTIREFIPYIGRLSKMGAGMLWIMPVHPVGQLKKKGSLGSYYSVRDYFAIDPFYGSLDDFREMVRTAHAEGLYVILDWVANHTAWDNELTLNHPDYYVRDAGGNFLPPFPEWEDVIHLDYNNPDLRRYMIQAMQYWIEETGIDGFRCDMANLVPLPFWTEAIAALRSRKDLFMLAEAEDRQLLESGFDVIYNWKLLHFFNKLIREPDNARILDQLLEDQFYTFPEHSSQLLFTSNHDENSWNGSAIERLGSALEAATVLTFTLPGIPLIYSGQEAGLLKRLSFFDKDLIPWKEDKMAKLYEKLSHLKRTNQAIQSDGYGGGFRRIPNSKNSQVFTFIRERNGNRLIVMVNLDWKAASFKLEGYSAEGEYVDPISGTKVYIAPGATWTLAPWGYYILSK